MHSGTGPAVDEHVAAIRSLRRRSTGWSVGGGIPMALVVVLPVLAWDSRPGLSIAGVVAGAAGALFCLVRAFRCTHAIRRHAVALEGAG